MQRLLMATDLSPRSDHALARALRLAEQHGAELRVVHVVDDALPSHLATAQRAGAESLIRERVQALAGEKARPVTVDVVTGSASTEILRAAVAGSAELIVIGAHRGGKEGTLRGSTAERVIREGHHPVLVVRRAPEADYRRVVVGVDFSLHALWAARCGFRIAPTAEFHLVHSYVPPIAVFLTGNVHAQARELHVRELNRAIDEEMGAFLARLGDRLPPHHRHVVEGSASEVVLHEAVRLPADLIVAGTHGRTGVAYALLGSVAEDLLWQAPCDVLLARAW